MKHEELTCGDLLLCSYTSQIKADPIIKER